MKFGITGRDITDKNKFMSANNKKSNFLDRFKGRTIQMSREGHLGIVKSTNAPIKPVPENKNHQISNAKMRQMGQIKKPNPDSFRNVKPKNNFEALSPFKRSNSVLEENSGPRNDRYNSFAKNYHKVENALSKSYNSNGLRKGLSKAGGQILGGNHKDINRNDYPKMNSSHSMVPIDSGNKPEFGMKNRMNAPNSSKANPVPFNQMKKPRQRMSDGHINHQQKKNLITPEDK